MILKVDFRIFRKHRLLLLHSCLSIVDGSCHSSEIIFLFLWYLIFHDNKIQGIIEQWVWCSMLILHPKHATDWYLKVTNEIVQMRMQRHSRKMMSMKGYKLILINLLQLGWTHFSLLRANSNLWCAPCKKRRDEQRDLDSKRFHIRSLT